MLKAYLHLCYKTKHVRFWRTPHGIFETLWSNLRGHQRMVCRSALRIVDTFGRTNPRSSSHSDAVPNQRWTKTRKNGGSFDQTHHYSQRDVWLVESIKSRWFRGNPDFSGIFRKKIDIDINICGWFITMVIETNHVISPSGFLVYVGRNAKENEYISTVLIESDDYWFHALDVPGSLACDCRLLCKSRGCVVCLHTRSLSWKTLGFYSNGFSRTRYVESFHSSLCCSTSSSPTFSDLSRAMTPTSWRRKECLRLWADHRSTSVSRSLDPWAHSHRRIYQWSRSWSSFYPFCEPY